MNNNTFKSYWLVGLITPIYYFVLMESLAHLWTGYSSIAQHMSELGGVESPYKDIMNYAGFAGVGVLIISFRIGFYCKFKSSNLWLQLASLMLFVGGLFMIVVAFFPCDPHCIDVTRTGRLHTLTSIPQSIALPTAAILAGFGFAQLADWSKKWLWVSIVLGSASMLAGPLLSVEWLKDYVGLIQRFGIGFSLLWIWVVSLELFKNRLP